MPVEEKVMSFISQDINNKDSGGIIHVGNIKGGVGKSTIATNLAAAFSLRGPTLLIDLDVQASASHALGVDPHEHEYSSWDLSKRHYHYPQNTDSFMHKIKTVYAQNIQKIGEKLLPSYFSLKDITSLAIPVRNNLSVIPANSDLFRHIHFYHLYNLIHNIYVSSYYYKFIFIDTPSVWNKIIKMLFIYSDLNLIPVTLSALSTRSLRDYLKNVKQLTHNNPSIRIRIIKNEVYGNTQTKHLVGKTKTVHENRLFLESLCEQVVISNSLGVSLLPQSIIFDLEIPESSTIRSAQDSGKAVHDYRHYSPIAKAFDALARRVQVVLNNPLQLPAKKSYFPKHLIVSTSSLILSIISLLFLFSNNNTIISYNPPAPIAPQQLTTAKENVLEYTFTETKSLLKLAKYAICRFCAIVPTSEQINDYLQEVIAIHNLTRKDGAAKISPLAAIPQGTLIRFYPPLKISNTKSASLVPVYQYFTAMVEDSFAYVTGDWCERGYGGGTPHYGIDVATPYGTKIISPIDGVVSIQNSTSGGRMFGVINDNMIIFFAHMDKRFFKNGAFIKRGTVVGTVGMTGITSGPHVHIGYGLETPSYAGTTRFGNRYYNVTDTKLFFYREQYLTVARN